MILQWVLTVYVYNHKEETALEYFTVDSLAIIFLTVLSIICVPAFYHSYVLFNTERNIPRERGIYYAAMVALIASLTMAYLSNHIGVTWIFCGINYPKRLRFNLPQTEHKNVRSYMEIYFCLFHQHHLGIHWNIIPKHCNTTAGAERPVLQSIGNKRAYIECLLA